MLAVFPQSCSIGGSSSFTRARSVEDSFSSMHLVDSSGGGVSCGAGGGSASGGGSLIGGRRPAAPGAGGTRHRRTESHELALQLLYLGTSPYCAVPPKTAQEHVAAVHKRCKKTTQEFQAPLSTSVTGGHKAVHAQWMLPKTKQAELPRTPTRVPASSSSAIDAAPLSLAPALTPAVGVTDTAVARRITSVVDSPPVSSPSSPTVSPEGGASTDATGGGAGSGAGGGSCAVAADGEAKLWPDGMAMPLPPQVAWRMLCSSDSSPSSAASAGGDPTLPCRPNQFSPTDGAFIFKESGVNDYGAIQQRMKLSKEAGRSASKAVPDRWHNSGGARGARDMKISEAELVRRRYGSILQGGKIMWRYHEYCQVRATGKTVLDEVNGKLVPELVEDRQTLLYHVMPRRSGRGRPAKSEVLAQSQLWARLSVGSGSSISASHR